MEKIWAIVEIHFNGEVSTWKQRFETWSEASREFQKIYDGYGLHLPSDGRWVRTPGNSKVCCVCLPADND